MAWQHVEVLIARVRSGDEQAESKLYAILGDRFLGLALSFFNDPHQAQTAFNDAFLKLVSKLRGNFTYQGQARFYAYFNMTLLNSCRDHYRDEEPHRRWEAEHQISGVFANAEEEGDDVELVEHVVGYDPQALEAQARWSKTFRQELEELFEKELTPQDARFWEAYRALTETPGSQEWGYQEKTAFLKRYLGLPKTAFYPAHSRFKQRIKPFAQRWKLVTSEEEP